MAIQRKSLGRGLGSIISAGAKKSATPLAKSAPAPSAQPEQKEVKISSHGLFSEIPTEKVIPSPYQARREFAEDEISNLADSIASEGLLQPILVRQSKDGYYELLAGERWVRECRKFGIKKIVAWVHTASDSSAAAKGLIENIQRANLNPVEEARGIAYLMDNFKLTQESVSQRLGKPRSSIANSLRLLKLPEEVQGYISSGLISLGHAKVIMGIDEGAQQVMIARRIIESGLNVRSTEDALRRLKSSGDKRAGAAAAASAKDAVIRDIQNKISTRLNASVELRHTPKRGKIIIEYLGNDDLQRILDVIGVKV